MKRFSLALCIVALWASQSGFAQSDPTKNYDICKHWELIEQIRAYEDSLAHAASLPDTLRGEYGLLVTDAGVSSKVYRLYRCAALQDTLDRFRDSLTFARTSPPTVFRDSITGVTGTAATFWGKWTNDGDTTITALWFAYGTSQGALTDTVHVLTIPPTANTAFSASVSTLTAGTTYYVAAFARNAKGTASSDTLSFSTFQCGMSVNYQSYAYTTVQIGTQCWFKENLRASNYKDGTTIPSGLDATAWSTATTGAVTTYGEGSGTESGNLNTYGRLYNWYAITDSRGLCPAGWHVPDSTEWMTLFLDQGGLSLAGGKLKAASPTWDGTNDSGFTALDGGLRRPAGNHDQLGYLGAFWSTTSSGTNARYFYMTDGSNGIAPYPDVKTHGLSVRCLKN
jgi:uncharacterized protein (TIGR02145 family)